MTDAEICSKLNVKVGDCLIGDEGHGPTIIRITAIGEDNILARSISHNGKHVDESEGRWTLAFRDWTKIT